MVTQILAFRPHDQGIFSLRKFGILIDDFRIGFIMIVISLPTFHPIGTRADILEEIQGRYVDKLELMNRELTKKKDEYTKLDDLVKQQRIYISSNYEAYIGKEFVDKEKLAELCNIMKSGACTTIAQAIAEYKNQH